MVVAAPLVSRAHRFDARRHCANSSVSGWVHRTPAERRVGYLALVGGVLAAGSHRDGWDWLLYGLSLTAAIAAVIGFGYWIAGSAPPT